MAVYSHLSDNNRSWRGRSHSVQSQDYITHTISSSLMLLHLCKVMHVYAYSGAYCKVVV